MWPEGENFAFSVLCAFFFSLLLLWIFTKRRIGLPPGPPCRLFLGNIGQFDPKQIKRDFKRLRAQYGDVFCFMMSYKPMIVVNGAEKLREFMIKRSDVFSERPSIFFTEVVSNGYGITGSSGHLWTEQRSFTRMVLRNLGVGKMGVLENQILEEVSVFLQDMENFGDEPFDISSLLYVSVSNIICSLAFGTRFEHDDRKFRHLLKLMNDNLSGGNAGASIVTFFPFLRHLPGDLFGAKREMRNEEEIMKFLQELVEDHRKDSLDVNYTRDYIDAFLVAQAQNKGDKDTTFTDHQLLHTIRDFFAGDTETIVTTLRWAVLFLISYPEIQRKLKDEIDHVIGTNKYPSLQEKSELPYCEAFITETHRMGSILPLAIPHGVKHDVILDGYCIPRGSIVVANLESVAFDPELFSDPENFNPERFIGNDGKCKGQEKFYPFSLGKRMCIGDSLAKSELFLFLTSLVQRFELRPEDEKSLPSLEGRQGVMHSPIPFKIRARKRH